MPSYGLTPEGFNAKPLDVVQSEIDAGLKTILGESAGTEPDGTIPLRSAGGQMKTFLTDGFAALWDLLQLLYSSFDPSAATGIAQDNVCSITGTQREEQSFSQVVETCTGTPGTILTINRVVTVTTTGTRFLSTAQQTISLLTSWVGSTPYIVGNRRTNVGRAYICILAGTSAGAGGPSTTSSNILDGTARWKYLGEGTGAVDVNFQAETAGAFAAVAGSLVNVATPVSGWQNAVNLLDATLGSIQETDSSLRIRRETELAAAGNATPDAIRTNVLKVNEGSTDPAHLPVDACRVFYNDSDVVDVDGLPPHSVEVLVQGAPDTDVAAAVFASVAAGIKSTGTTLVVVQDSVGANHDVRFTRPTLKTIWITADVTYDPLKFPTDLAAGSALIKDALVLFGDTYQIGVSVRSSALAAQIFDGPTAEGGSPVPGILDVTSLLIRLISPPISPATIIIAARERAVFDTSRIVVNLIPGTP